MPEMVLALSQHLAFYFRSDRAKLWRRADELTGVVVLAPESPKLFQIGPLVLLNARNAGEL